MNHRILFPSYKGSFRKDRAKQPENSFSLVKLCLSFLMYMPSSVITAYSWHHHFFSLFLLGFLFTLVSLRLVLGMITSYSTIANPSMSNENLSLTEENCGKDFSFIWMKM